MKVYLGGAVVTGGMMCCLINGTLRICIASLKSLTVEFAGLSGPGLK